MAVPADLDRITAEQDRSATQALLGVLADASTGEEDRDEVAAALASLADPRSVGPLLAMAENTALDAAVRAAALDALAGAALCPEGDHLRRWWDSGDEELQKRALVEADRTEADLVGPVADDPTHPLHAQAISGIAFSFEEPEWQDRKIRALSHPSADVRTVAAATLLWDEPVRAETLLHDAVGDPDPDVAVVAIEALEYYPTRSSVVVLNAVVHAGDDDRAPAAAQALDTLRGRFHAALATDPPIRSRLRRWMEPVWPILGGPDDPPETGDGPPSDLGPDTKMAVPPAAELMRIYDNPDGPWAAKLACLFRYDWEAVAERDRPTLRRYFMTHPDPAVRERCSAALAAWHATEELLSLAHDPLSWVRKPAIYHLADVPPSEEIARLAWDLIARGEVASTRGGEALRTYSAHAPANERVDTLIELGRTDRRETLRYEAVCLLDDVTPLLGLLADPPLVTWGVHVILLASCAEIGITPPVGHLLDVDNLDIAEALAEFEHPAT